MRLFNILLSFIFLTFPLFSNANNSNFFEMPWTLNSASAQASLKKILYEALLENNEGEKKYPIQGNYNKIILEDENYQIICEEQQVIILTVQKYRCYFIEK